MNVASLVQLAMTSVPSDLKAAVTFRRSTRTYDSTANTDALAETTVVGVASRGEGDPDTYKALNLIESEAPTLVFVPTTAGELPSIGDTVVWGGATYVVKNVNPISPAGVAFAADVVIAR